MAASPPWSASAGAAGAAGSGSARHHARPLVLSTSMLHIVGVPLLILASIGVGFVLVYLKEVLLPFVVAVLFVYLLRPLVNILTTPFSVILRCGAPARGAWVPGGVAPSTLHRGRSAARGPTAYYARIPHTDSDGPLGSGAAPGAVYRAGGGLTAGAGSGSGSGVGSAGLPVGAPPLASATSSGSSAGAGGVTAGLSGGAGTGLGSSRRRGVSPPKYHRTLRGLGHRVWSAVSGLWSGPLSSGGAGGGGPAAGSGAGNASPHVHAASIADEDCGCCCGVCRITRCPRWFAILVSLCVAVSVLAGLVLLVADAIQRFQQDSLSLYIRQAGELARELQSWFLLFNIHLEASSILDAITQQISVMNVVQTTLTVIVDGVGNGILVILLVLYLLAEQSQHAPGSIRAKVDNQIQRYVVIKTAISAAQGIFVFFILGYLLNVRMAHVFGVLHFFLNYIPTAGPIIATIVPLPIVILDPDLGLTAKIVAFAAPTAVHMVVGNFLEPLVFGSSMELHPVTILLALAVWYALWGIPGAILAVPITAVMRIILSSIDHTYAYVLINILEGRLSAASAEIEGVLESTLDAPQAADLEAQYHRRSGGTAGEAGLLGAVYSSGGSGGYRDRGSSGGRDFAVYAGRATPSSAAAPAAGATSALQPDKDGATYATAARALHGEAGPFAYHDATPQRLPPHLAALGGSAVGGLSATASASALLAGGGAVGGLRRAVTGPASAPAQLDRDADVANPLAVGAATVGGGGGSGGSAGGGGGSHMGIELVGTQPAAGGSGAAGASTLASRRDTEDSVLAGSWPDLSTGVRRVGGAVPSGR